MNRNADQIRPELRKRMRDVADGKSPWPFTILGDVGTGKTYAALCLLDAVGGGCCYKTVVELCEDSIAACKGELFDDQTGTKLTTLIYWNRWREARLTVLDEIGGRDNVSDHHRECVQRALDKRQGQPCIYISNLDLDTIARLYDRRIASRLSQGTVVQVTGPDRRLIR